MTSGKHFFQVSFAWRTLGGTVSVGWVDDKITVAEHDLPGLASTQCSGVVYLPSGLFWFGTAPLADNSSAESSGVSATPNARQVAIGCLLNLDATPARVTVFVDGEPLAQQCPYDFPKDGRAWFPTAALYGAGMALHSCAI